MSNWNKALERRSLRSPDARLERFPISAREHIRDQLHTIRLQLDVLGLDEAEMDMRAAILAVCAGLQIPNLLSVEQLMELGDRNDEDGFH